MVFHLKRENSVDTTAAVIEAIELHLRAVLAVNAYLYGHIETS